MSAVEQEILRPVEIAEASPVSNLPAVNPMQMLQIAVSQGADMEKLQKLMDLQERWEKSQARKAYVAAMSQFKANPPTILKNKHVNYKNKSGGYTDYDHATHFEVTNAIIKALAAVGISHRWIPEQANGIMKVTCELTHADGHSESVSLSGPYDESGGKNAIQAVVSAKTYLERHTLLAASGMSTAGEEDDDGRGAGGPPTTEGTITATQVADLEALITEVGTTTERFLKYAQIERLEDLPANKFTKAVQAIRNVGRN